MVEQPQRYCTNCGHELKPDDQFCTNCGVPVHRAARVPTPKADRPVPPLPPPTQEVGRGRSLPGSGALRGRGGKLAVLLVLGVLVLYLVSPLVIESLESLIAGKVQTALGTQTKPDVKVSSDFPPMMLLGRISRVEVSLEQITITQPDGDVVTHFDPVVNMSGVSVSVPSLIVGELKYEAESCFVQAQNLDSEECPSQLFGSS